MDRTHPNPILSPKLQIPPSRLQLVTRERLLTKLQVGLHRKLTLISAPAGYGKTTLLCEWAIQWKWKLAWVTITAGDNDIERFLAYLISALQTTDAGFSGLENLFSFSVQPMPLDAVMAILVNELASIDERLVVVLDDYHLIENEEIHRFITDLLEHLPANIHIIMATRSDPPIRLARLRAKDQLNEITEHELRFTIQEAENFFFDVMGLGLSQDQVAEIETRTEGWVTALQLVGLSLKDRQHPENLIATLDGTHRYILDYLVEEVFGELPPMLQTFLLRVSILERLNPGLCDFVVGNLPEGEATPRSKEILEFMDMSNLFVTPLDSQRQWYRFHPLFSKFLQDHLEHESPDDLAILHSRAAEWFAEHGLPAEAVHHAFAAQEMSRTADLIQNQVRDLLRRGEISTLLRWVELLPEEAVRARPQLSLAHVWGMLMRKPLVFWESAQDYIDQIAKGLNVRPDELLAIMAEGKSDEDRRAMLGEFAMLLAFVGRDTQDIDATTQLFKVAYEFLPESEAMLRGFTLAGLASTYGRAGKIKLAEETFAKAAQISLSVNSTFGYVASTDWQATMQVEMGQLKRAFETYHQAISALSSQGQSPLPLSGHVYVGLASVLLDWNDLEGALENVNLGLKIGVQVRDIDALLFGYALQARILLALNRQSEAQIAIENAEQQALKTTRIGCLQDAQAQKAHYALAMGDIEAAQRWATGRGILPGNSMELALPLGEIEIFTYARLLMATGEHDQALLLLKPLLEVQESTGRQRAFVENLVLHSLCYHAQGVTDQALRTLARALLLTEPENSLRVFIEGGPAMAALLRTAGARGHSPAFVKQLLSAFGETPASEGPLEALSQRELDVLNLVAQGLNNAEIAAELVIAQSTVKTHINRIYRKLDAITRTQAVAKARQMRIIS